MIDDMRSAIRIIIADDHPIVRDGLVAVLTTQADFAIIGEANNGTALVTAALALRPDVVLTDLAMPIVDGVDAIRRLRDALPTTRIIVLTAFDTDDRIIGALEAGAHGYLLKGAPRAEIFNAIRVVHSGGSLLQPLIAARLIQRATTPAPDQLSPREREVLALLAKGHANKAIAATLHVTERTVKFHVSAILAKLDAINRTQAVTLARQRGLLAE